MMTNRALKTLFAAIVSVTSLSAGSAAAQGDASLVGLTTDGAVHEINLTTGALTLKAQEAFTSFSLGAVARRKRTFYYVAAPSGSTENAIFTVNLTTGAISKVDLDRAQGDDEVRSLFFNGRQLLGVFYNGTAGTAGLYKISPLTGITKLLLDLSAFNFEPIPGAISRVGPFFYMIVKPETDSTVRQLVRFRPGKRTIKTSTIATSANAPVLCEKLKPNRPRTGFICLAAPSSTQVDVCRLNVAGRAFCTGTLSGIERVGGGHTMMSTNGKNFSAFVYVPGETDNQRLITFTAAGVIKNNASVPGIFIGGRFGADEVEPS